MYRPTDYYAVSYSQLSVLLFAEIEVRVLFYQQRSIEHHARPENPYDYVRAGFGIWLMINFTHVHRVQGVFLLLIP